MNALPEIRTAIERPSTTNSYTQSFKHLKRKKLYKEYTAITGLPAVVMEQGKNYSAMDFAWRHFNSNYVIRIESYTCIINDTWLVDGCHVNAHNYREALDILKAWKHSGTGRHKILFDKELEEMISNFKSK